VLGHADPRSDIYALGATLHALVTGRRPDAEYTRLLHSGLDVEGAMRALFPAAHTLVPGVPAWLGQVLAKATAFSAADRYDDAASMAAALRHTSRQNRGAARRVVPAPPARPQPSVAPATTVGAASSSVPGGPGSIFKLWKGHKRRAFTWSGLILTVSFLAITRSYAPVLFNDATLLAFVFGIPTLIGVFSWLIYKTHPIISVIGWLFTGFWFTCIAIVVAYVIALYLIPHPK
jgi:hypothetical protein